MPKQGLAVVTMCYNEPDFLPIWLDYYRRQVPVEHLYVVDHGSDDGSTSNLGGANLVRLPRTPLDEEARCKFVSDFCNSLLNYYEYVAYTDVDELLVADPRHHTGLLSLCMAAEHDVTTALGMHLAHYLPDEPALRPDAPILQQRRTAFPIGSECKPNLIRRPVRWNPGFHHGDAPSAFGDLFLLHLAYCDIPIVRRRQRKRLATARVEGHGLHHGWAEAQFVAHIESWSDFPVDEGVDLGRECRVRAEFIARLLASSSGAGSPPMVDSLVVGGPGLWRIPDRFRQIF